LQRVHGAVAESIGVALLFAALAVAVLRPRGVSEALVAVPAACVVVLLGIVPWHDAARTLDELGPTVGFLAGILVFGRLCADAGVFTYLGARAARLGGARPRRLLALVVVLAASVTAVLTLDATVVLVTPVVLAVSARAGVAVKPNAYACARLANSGSLLLPVSNLTNLLAFSATNMSFGRFAALMALPWVIAVAGEWVGLRWFFRRDLPRTVPPHAEPVPPAPRYALGVLAVTVAAFVVLSAFHVPVAWAAAGGCVLMLLPRRLLPVVRMVRAASLGFCAFVFAIAIVVDAVVRNGLGDVLRDVLPAGHSFPALLAVAVVAAVLANVVNNLPATLVLIPLVAADPIALLAVLLGVNVGPNATYAGSLATLLWRRLLPRRDRPGFAEFHRFGLLTVPPLLVAVTAGLWASATWLGLA
jgi:arsenical pump membrane protein